MFIEKLTSSLAIDLKLQLLGASASMALHNLYRTIASTINLRGYEFQDVPPATTGCSNNEVMLTGGSIDLYRFVKGVADGSIAPLIRPTFGRGCQPLDFYLEDGKLKFSFSFKYTTTVPWAVICNFPVVDTIDDVSIPASGIYMYNKKPTLFLKNTRYRYIVNYGGRHINDVWYLETLSPDPEYVMCRDSMCVDPEWVKSEYLSVFSAYADLGPYITALDGAPSHDIAADKYILDPQNTALINAVVCAALDNAVIECRELTRHAVAEYATWDQCITVASKLLDMTSTFHLHALTGYNRNITVDTIISAGKDYLTGPCTGNYSTHESRKLIKTIYLGVLAGDVVITIHGPQES